MSDLKRGDIEFMEDTEAQHHAECGCGWTAGPYETFTLMIDAALAHRCPREDEA